MSELLNWFTQNVQSTIHRPRAKNYACFTTALRRINDLLDEQVPTANFIHAFETMQDIPPEGYESKPGNIRLRRKFQWMNGRGFLDLSQAINGTRRPFSTDSLLVASVYHTPTQVWHTGFFVESEPVHKSIADQDPFPFPSSNFHAFSFTKRPNFKTFFAENADMKDALRQISILRRGKEQSNKTLGECFVRRIVKGPDYRNISFPHL